MKKDKEQMERLGKQLKFTAQALATMGLSGALTLLAACAPQQSQPRNTWFLCYIYCFPHRFILPVPYYNQF